MFLVVSLNQAPTTASFKVSPEEFAEMTTHIGFAPTPYLARYHWVLTENIKNLREEEWERHIRQSYALVASKLPKKLRQALPLS